ncbi:DUF4249 domain-containing protein [Cochleicola gelatinilyticus]|uniref:DUF4249 domain-containing protein n=1 Tax=Cochleicola gelatinilyticus TaxID=1763537 RepID=A0A167HCC5_9FLAO|nr:DUF4249 domain-containing protein [Cochleicola gelatinilyticus]OAB78473.1 hypothetical protein ULVI_07710 [Cochleicola gelatinilyticus]
MKRLLAIVFCFLPFVSCEDVIDLDLNEAEPRLVIDAEIVKSVENDSSVARVRISLTTPFFENEPAFINNAMVTITDSNGAVFTLENTSDGFYSFPDFNPEVNTAYTLQVIYNTEIYSATELLQTVVPLEYIEQDNDGGFLGDEIELKAFYTDPVGEENFYFFEGLGPPGNVRDVFDDEFTNGNQVFALYVTEDLAIGDDVYFYLYGVNEQFYNYMSLLLQQTGGGGPFETQPATVKGNIVNETNLENYPLGYFRISEVSVLSYTVQ